MKRTRGLSLGSTLLVACLVVTLGLALSGVSVTHLNLSARATSNSSARDLARSVLALAVERIQGNADFGAPGQPTDVNPLRVQFEATPGEGLLTFDPAEARRLGIPLSVNNLAGGRSLTTPDGQTVPTQAVYLVAVGRSGGTERRVEAVLHLPPFPYAAASDGPIRSRGGLLVAAVESGQPVDLKQLQPADLRSNATGSRALVLGPDSTVSGDVVAAGDIELDGSTVMGAVRPNEAPEFLPRIQVGDFDPLATGRAYTEMEESYQGPQTLVGVQRRKGDLLLDGDVNLNGAVLFVEGTVTVRGSLRGNGLVATTGELRVERQVDMQAGDSVALVSAGKMSLQGTGRAGSSVRGVVYTEGGLEARQLSLRGTLVAHKGDRAQASEVDLYEAGLLKDESLSSVTVRTPRTQPFTITIAANGAIDPARGGGATLTCTPRANGTLDATLTIPATGGISTTAVSTSNQSNQTVTTGGGTSSQSSSSSSLAIASTGGGTGRTVPYRGITPAGLVDAVAQDIRKYSPSLEPTELRDRIRELMEQVPPDSPDVFTIDPSEMLTTPQRIRVVLWRES
ncbi:MAG: hypothetical protein AB1758_24005 [Candidatus Eremiobacterota bacterium]